MKNAFVAMTSFSLGIEYFKRLSGSMQRTLSHTHLLHKYPNHSLSLSVGVHVSGVNGIDPGIPCGLENWERLPCAVVKSTSNSVQRSPHLILWKNPWLKKALSTSIHNCYYTWNTHTPTRVTESHSSDLSKDRIVSDVGPSGS